MVKVCTALEITSGDVALSAAGLRHLIGPFFGGLTKGTFSGGSALGMDSDNPRDLRACRTAVTVEDVGEGLLGALKPARGVWHGQVPCYQQRFGTAPRTPA